MPKIINSTIIKYYEKVSSIQSSIVRKSGNYSISTNLQNKNSEHYIQQKIILIINRKGNGNEKLYYDTSTIGYFL